MFIGGIVVIVVGGLLLLFANKQKQTSDAMQKQKAVPTNQLQSNMQAEVQGNVVTQNPLKTPFSDRECVYYEFEVEKEVRRRGRGTDGRPTTETDWETVEQDKKMIPFFIEDSAGKVAVNPEGATIEPRDLGEQRFRRGERFGNDFLRNLLSSVSDANMRASEKALFTGESAYVFGHVTEGAQGLEFNKSGKEFLISHKSEEQVQKSTARTATTMKVLGFIGLLGGIILMVYSFFQ
ncbi:GIDE domain-containing protein [Patescibacteria group bacterium]